MGEEGGREVGEEGKGDEGGGGREGGKGGGRREGGTCPLYQNGSRGNLVQT